MKRIQALVTAAIITGVLAACMLAIGLNAFFNPNTVQASNSPAQGAAPISTGGSGQTQQLENQIQQYQQQLDQANQEIQQYQDILGQLQQRGVIQVTPDGQILLRRGSFGGGGFGGDGQ